MHDISPFLVLVYVDAYAVERKWHLIGDAPFNKAVTDTIQYARKSTKALPAIRRGGKRKSKQAEAEPTLVYEGERVFVEL